MATRTCVSINECVKLWAKGCFLVPLELIQSAAHYSTNKFLTRKLCIHTFKDKPNVHCAVHSVAQWLELNAHAIYQFSATVTTWTIELKKETDEKTNEENFTQNSHLNAMRARAWLQPNLDAILLTQLFIHFVATAMKKSLFIIMFPFFWRLHRHTTSKRQRESKEWTENSVWPIKIGILA